jgi:hypothetical protein
VTRTRGRPAMLEGDIMVIRVAHYYSMGRITADGHTQTPIGAQNDRSGALRRARVLAGADHLVFLHEDAGPRQRLYPNRPPFDL